MSLELFEWANLGRPRLFMIETPDDMRTPINNLIVRMHERYKNYGFRLMCSTHCNVTPPVLPSIYGYTQYKAYKPIYWADFIKPCHFFLYEDGTIIAVDNNNVNLLDNKLAALLMSRWDSTKDNKSNFFDTEKELLRCIFIERALLKTN